jgi:hypothetical protein
METIRTNGGSSAAGEIAGDRDSQQRERGAQSTSAGEKAGLARSATVGGAIGHTAGVGKDVVVGGVAGGMAAGKCAARKIATKPFNPIVEHEFWRKEYKGRPYFTADTPYEQYGSAFRYGWECCLRHKGKTFTDVAAAMERDWEHHRGQSQLSWDHARNAVRDAWQRVEKNCRSGECSI